MDAFIIDAVFTPRASVRKGTSAYSDVHPQELLASCLRSLRSRQPGIFPEARALFVGCVTQVNDQGANLARNALLTAGMDESVSAFTLDMCCGSGLEAVNLAAASVAAGAEGLVIAGGVESMSRVKMASDGGGMDGNNLALRERLRQVPQGICADFLATREGLQRNDLDSYALESHRKAAAAREQGYFQPLYSFVEGPDSRPLLLDEDHIRDDASLEKLSMLPPAFSTLGAELEAQGIIGAGRPISALQYLHTAGTASGIADGAGALLIASGRFAADCGASPRARVLGTCARGSDPIAMLTGPAGCCEELLRSCRMSVRDVDLWEINEAFAVVPLETMRRLQIDPARVNIKGGSIARGHPLGATGAILLACLAAELEKEDRAVGCAVLCVAGGQSVATLIERC